MSALRGMRVVVTRTREQASAMVAQLEDRGATAIEVPVIATMPPVDDGEALREAVANIERYDWVMVTSPTGATRLVDALARQPLPPGVLLAAVGPRTVAALESGGLETDLVPETFVAEALLDAFPDPPADGRAEKRRVLLARAAVGRDVLPDGLRAAGWEVDVVEAYQTVPATITEEQRQAVAAADVVTFTASSTVERFLDLIGRDYVPATVAVIGPITAATARSHGLNVDVEASEHTIAGLVAALDAHAGAAEDRAAGTNPSG